MESSSSLLPWRSAVLPPIFLYSYSVTFCYLQFFLIYFGQGRVTMFPYEMFAFIWQWKQRVTEKLEGGGGKALLPMVACSPPELNWHPTGANNYIVRQTILGKGECTAMNFQTTARPIDLYN